MNLWNLVPELSFHAHFKDKKHFELTHDCYEIWVMFIVEKGSFSYTMDEITRSVSDGEIVICPPNTLFYRKTITPISFHFIRFDWEGKYEDETKIPRGKISISNSQRLYSTLSLFRKASNSNDEQAIEFKKHLLRDIWLVYLFDVISSDVFEDDISTDDLLLEDALRYIKLHIYEKILISDIAKVVGLTHVQFLRRFKNEFNINPNQYITNKRLNKSKRLLVDTTLSLSKIAELSGFDNEYYFSNSFKKHINMSPSVYRNINRI